MTELIVAVLENIETEMARQYWNKYQKEFCSPFRNTGEIYSNDIFTVRAYNWNGNYEPNFEYKNLKVYWYKWLGRGVEFECDTEIDIKFLAHMLNDCRNSLDNI